MIMKNKQAMIKKTKTLSQNLLRNLSKMLKHPVKHSQQRHLMNIKTRLQSQLFQPPTQQNQQKISSTFHQDHEKKELIQLKLCFQKKSPRRMLNPMSHHLVQHKFLNKKLKTWDKMIKVMKMRFL
jgi:hypothetical protein